MKRISIIMAIALILFGASFIFNNGAQAAGKPEKIVYGIITDMTGPYAASAGPSYAAFMDATEYVNDTGGIRGVPLEAVVRDCAGKVDVGVNIYMQFREMKPCPGMIYGIMSTIGEALKNRLNEDQIPAMWVPSTEAVYPAMYTFGTFPTYADSCGLFIDWLAETWKEKRAPRLAFLTWDTTFGKAVLYDEVFNYAKSKGIEVVATELFNIRDVDITNQMMRVRSKKADWIYTNTTANGPYVVAKTAKTIGYKVGIAGGPAFDDSCIYINPDVFEGAVVPYPFANWSESQNKGIQLMNKYFEKNKRKPTYKTILYPMGFTGVLVFKEVVGRIVDKYGWEKVNGPMIKKEMEALKDLNVENIATFSYTPKRHATNIARVFQVQGGKFIPITDHRKCPDMRPAQYR